MTLSPEALQKRDAEWQKQLEADRATLLQQPAFCRVMQALLAATGIWRISYAGEATHAMAFNEGQRNVGLRLVTELEQANPQALLRLKAHAMPTSETPDDE